MSVWLIHPRDPLIFRDGKPFTATPGERAKSLVFPYPSTIAGAIRTLAGMDTEGHFDPGRIDEVKRLSVRGPLLVELTQDGQINNRFFPAPADTLLVQKGELVQRYCLAPLEMPMGAHSNLENLHLIGPSENIKDKPHPHPPRYWNENQFKLWLEKPIDGVVAPNGLGIQGPERETRAHVSMEPGTLTASPGALFQTSGMEFIQSYQREKETPQLENVRSLALALETEAAISVGLGFLGGERRVATWRKVEMKFPDCPPEVKRAINAQRHCRLILATPAWFKEGYLLAWLNNAYSVTVRAIALPRYQTISGWDYERQAPKPTRRLVPAGSVFFIALENDIDIDKFVRDVWLQSISDDEQSRRDGFGLALLGCWDGKLRKMEVKS